MGSPGALNTTGYRIPADPPGRVVVPAQALFMYVSRFWVWSQMLGLAIAMGFTYRMTAGS